MSLIITASTAAACLTFAAGANDASNTIATSIGSKAVKLIPGLVICCVFEFLGVITIGRLVSDTIRFGLVQQHLMPPQIYVLGMTSVLLASFFFLIVATLLGLPVSTTHTITAGFGLIQNGAQGVNTETIRNVGISWIASPVAGIVVGFVMYLILYKLVLVSPNAERNNKFVFPIMCGLTVGAVVAFVLVGLAKQIGFPFWIPAVIGAVLFLVVTLVAGFWIFPWWKQRQQEGTRNAFFDRLRVLVFPSQVDEEFAEEKESSVVYPETYQNDRPPLVEDDGMASPNKADGLDGSSLDIDPLDNLPQQTPYIFLMLLTAAVMGFAHGSNDSLAFFFFSLALISGEVANSVGPFSVVLEFIQTGSLVSGFQIPLWVFAVAGVILDIGIITLGAIVIETIGKKITKLSFIAGYSAQFASCSVVLVATLLGLPISTTHVVVGAVTGTAFVTSRTRQKLKKQWKVLAKILIGWVATIVVSAGLTIGIFELLKLGNWDFRR